MLIVHHNDYQLEVPVAVVLSLVFLATGRQPQSNMETEGGSDNLLRQCLHIAKAERSLDQLAALAHAWLIEKGYFYFVRMKALPVWHETEENVFLVYSQCQFDPAVQFHHPCAACLNLHKTCYGLWDQQDSPGVRTLPYAAVSQELDGRGAQPDMAASNVEVVAGGSPSARLTEYFNDMLQRSPDGVHGRDLEALIAGVGALILRHDPWN